jgi:hypothetical protein
VKLHDSLYISKLIADSDYKDDGTNILLDANENAVGPGLALNGEDRLPGAKANGASDPSSTEIDLIGLNRYPDPYEHFTDAARGILTISVTK